MAEATPKSECDVILLAIAREKESYAHLAAAAQTSTCPKAKRLYNQLALDELRHLLGLVSLMDSFSDDCLTQLDLSFPDGELPDPLPRSDDNLLGSAMAEEQRSQALFGELAESASREELVAFLERLQSEEAGHLVRLQSLLYGLEADRPVVAKWLRSIRRSAPTGSLH